MTSERVHHHDQLLYSPGTQVVALRDVIAPGGKILHPHGAVGVVVDVLNEGGRGYRVRFPDGGEEIFARQEVVMLAHYREGPIGAEEMSEAQGELFDRVMLRCVVGSRAYGLEDEASDTDYRGIYLPPAERHWSLYGVPDQIERTATQEQYWELQRFLVLALKANPTVLECLYTPLVEHATPLAQELRAMRDAFLSRLLYQTYNGYVMSQFKRMEARRRNQQPVKAKHAMHLIRLLLTGIRALREGTIPVRVDEHREELLAIKRGEMPWEESEAWRRRLHQEFDEAWRATRLPERPDYERANALLIQARRLALAEELP